MIPPILRANYQQSSDLSTKRIEKFSRISNEMHVISHSTVNYRWSGIRCDQQMEFSSKSDIIFESTICKHQTMTYLDRCSLVCVFHIRSPSNAFEWIWKCEICARYCAPATLRMSRAQGHRYGQCVADMTMASSATSTENVWPSKWRRKENKPASRH